MRGMNIGKCWGTLQQQSYRLYCSGKSFTAEEFQSRQLQCAWFIHIFDLNTPGTKRACIMPVKFTLYLPSIRPVGECQVLLYHLMIIQRREDS